MTEVAGYCPMGCGSTLFVDDAGRIACSFIGCLRPDAVADLLTDRETEHIVQFGEDGFTVRHPLRERLDDELMSCQLHALCASVPGLSAERGTYRVARNVDGETENWAFTQLE